MSQSTDAPSCLLLAGLRRTLAHRAPSLQALSLKFSADRDALKAELAAAKAAVAAGRPPTAGADQVGEQQREGEQAPCCRPAAVAGAAPRSCGVLPIAAGLLSWKLDAIVHFPPPGV